jgi:2-methylcitrate dehydratase
VTSIDILTFDVAYNIIGGGEEGEKKTIRTKEEADHSLPYMVAVALLDGQVMPQQYTPERIQREDVQNLIRNVHVQPSQEFSMRFPNEMPCRVTLHLKDREPLTIEKKDYEGFFTRPMSFQSVIRKFDVLTHGAVDEDLRQNLLDAVRNLENIQVRDLTQLLSKVRIVATQAYVA